MQYCFTGYRTRVLQRLQEIVENQQDILAMQRQLLAAVAVTVTEEDGEFLQNGPCQTVEELQTLDRELENKEKRAKMVILMQNTQIRYQIFLHMILALFTTWCK